MKLVKGGQEEQKKDLYNPNKKYVWQKEDIFELNGEDFGIILNTFRGILGTREAANIIMVDRANQAIEAIMANAVNKGIVKEMEEPKK